MKRLNLLTKLLMAIGLYTTATTAQDAIIGPADMIIWEGNIYTADDNNPNVEAVAVKDGIIVYAGNKRGANAYMDTSTTVISLSGASMYPGFTDGHAHIAGVGERELTLNLEGTASITALKQTIAEWHKMHQGEILFGRGWIETHWPEKRFPSRWDLDEIISDIPVILARADGHAMVANSAALKAAGITSDTKVPFGGDILKNALGEPTGILIDAAMSLVTPLLPTMTDERRAQALAKGSEVYAKYGWTGTHSMSTPWAEVPIMERLADEAIMKIRVYNSVDMGDAGKLFESGPRSSNNGRIITRAIKMYMDGALGSRGAALIEPYSDANTHGLIMMKEGDALPIMRRALMDGLQINTHAIGDMGNRLVLDWYQKTFAEVPTEARKLANPRWRIEHAQVINPADIPRFNQMGVIPSMQPSHAIGDMHFAPARLSDNRLYGAYAWKSLINSGVIVVGGSDAPVERGDPRIEFYAAVARKDTTGFSADNWHEEEAVTREEALKMFTLWPAQASFQEDSLGSITVGKRADFTAFSGDIMTMPEASILTTNVVLTIVDGEIIYAEKY